MPTVFHDQLIRKILARVVANFAFVCLTIMPLPNSLAAEFIPLGFFPGPNPPGSNPATPVESDARGISDDGLAVIGHSTGSDGAVFRWTPTEGMVGLRPGTFGTTPVISSGGSTVAWSRDRETHIWSVASGLTSVPEFTNPDGLFGISADGSLFAGTDPNSAAGQGLPVRWSLDSGFQELPVPENVTEPNYGSMGISAAGNVVTGVFENRTTVPCQACGLPFRWTENDGTTVLGNVPGDNYYEIVGMSDDGSVVMGWSAPDRSATPNRLWRWTSEAGLVVIEESPAGRRFTGSLSQGRGKRRLMSADGSILGVNTVNSDGTGAEAHLWSEEGGLQTIAGLPGATEKAIIDISSDGSVAFGGSDSDLVLWTEALGAKSLVDILIAQGVDPNVLEGWALTETRGGLWTLSGSGNAIAGSGTNPDGIREAWVAYFDPFVVPEPSSLLLATLAPTGLLSFRKRRVPRGMTALTTIALLGSTLAATAPAAEFVPLGFLEGETTGTVVIGSSADGSVAVGLQVKNGWNTVFRWMREGGMVEMFKENPRTHDRGLVVSADGSTVVWHNNGTRMWSETTGYQTIDIFEHKNISADGSLILGASVGDGPAIWTAEAGLGALPNPLGTGGMALFTSPDESVITGTTANIGQAYRWTATEGTTLLGTIPTDDVYRVRGMSDDGSTIIGVSHSGLSTPSNKHLWRWTEQSGISFLDPDLGYSFQSDEFSADSLDRRALSADGNVIAGWRVIGGDPTFTEAFRWTASAGIEVIPGLADYSIRSKAIDMSADGSLIHGGSVGVGGEVGLWLWTEATGTLSLPQVLAQQGLAEATAGWSWSTSGLELSDDGNALFGGGTNPDGNFEAFVIYLDPLLVPEPSSLLLGTFALMNMGLVRWRRFNA